MTEFKLPSLGADMDEGTLLEWRIAPGDHVRKGQIVAVVDTTKAAVEVESFQEGTVQELLVEPGTKVPVGTAIAVFSGGSEPVTPAAESSSRRASPTPAALPTESAQVSRPEPGARRRVSPAARKLASELQIGLDAVTGTGPEGAVTLEDVQRAHAPAASTSLAATAREAEKRVAMRRTIAAAMSRSKREIPHYYLTEPILMDRALTWLEQWNAERTIAERVLPAALVLKAVARALERYPEFNGFYRGERFEAATDIHLGVAIALRQGGLVAPALFDVNHMELSALMRALAALIQRTRAGTLRSSELSDATVTVTNLGDQGAETALGVIYPPQVALIGVGRIVERPWAEGGALRAAHIAMVSLSADHRVSDGHRGARLLAEIRDVLQEPEALAKGRSG